MNERNGRQRDGAAPPGKAGRDFGNRGVWALSAFLLLSMWARTGFHGVPSPPPAWDALLGRPPPPVWIDGAFVVYLFAALILSLTRLAAPAARFAGFAHLGYLGAFYAFYALSGALEEGFWAVLVGGSVLLVLETYREHLRRRGPGEGE